MNRRVAEGSRYGSFPFVETEPAQAEPALPATTLPEAAREPQPPESEPEPQGIEPEPIESELEGDGSELERPDIGLVSDAIVQQVLQGPELSEAELEAIAKAGREVAERELAARRKLNRQEKARLNHLRYRQHDGAKLTKKELEELKALSERE